MSIDNAELQISEDRSNDSARIVSGTTDLPYWRERTEEKGWAPNLLFPCLICSFSFPGSKVSQTVATNSNKSSATSRCFSCSNIMANRGKRYGTLRQISQPFYIRLHSSVFCSMGFYVTVFWHSPEVINWSLWNGYATLVPPWQQEHTCIEGTFPKSWQSLKCFTCWELWS